MSEGSQKDQSIKPNDPGLSPKSNQQIKRLDLHTPLSSTDLAADLLRRVREHVAGNPPSSSHSSEHPFDPNPMPEEESKQTKALPPKSPQPISLKTPKGETLG